MRSFCGREGIVDTLATAPLESQKGKAIQRARITKGIDAFFIMKILIQ
jgi:hypothetical protein